MKPKQEKTIHHLFQLSPDKIMKDFLLENEGEFNEEKINEVISEIELSLKKNLLAVNPIIIIFLYYPQYNI